MFVYFVYLLLFLAIVKFTNSKSIKEIILLSIISLSTFVVFLTEFLSLFKSLNLISIVIFYTIAAIILITYLLKNKKDALFAFRAFGKHIFSKNKSLKPFEKILLVVIVANLLILLFQGIIFPPNNWDSLTYHMSRIMYWIGNESVNHFPTHILRHLYQPPFAEYFILHLNILNGNDTLSNSLQWLFLIFTIVAVWSVLDNYKVLNWHKLFAALLLITIPSVTLQASTAKNDIICGFFVVVVLHYVIKSHNNPSIKNFVLLALSVGLGLLTKGTSYIFLAPILIIFAIFMLIKVIKTKDFKIITRASILILIVLLLNIGHYTRNYKINRNILNIDDSEAKMYVNVNMNSSLFISNLFKNIGLHAEYPFQNKFDKWLIEFHLKHKININSTDINYLNNTYQGPKIFETHEDLIPNGNHLIIIICCSICLLIISVFKYKNFKRELLLLLIIIFQIILFVGYLKWQPWHTRLHIPIFMMSVVLIILILKKIKILSIVLLMLTPILLYNFYFNVVYNKLRPIINSKEYTKNINISDSRFKKYFANQPHLYNEYAIVSNLIYDDNPNKIGLMLSDWEYPLLNNFYYEKIEVVAINVQNITNQIPQDILNINSIISNSPKTIFIEFNGKKYINQTPNNTYIWYYK